MLFDIDHTTIYRYSQAVFLEPHTVRLVPRSGADQQLLNFEITISPTPAGQTTLIDAEGNSAIQAWFGGTTDGLKIHTQCRVKTLRENPFDYLACDDSLPQSLPDELTAPLHHYQQRTAPTDPADDVVAKLSHSLAEAAGGSLCEFLNRLNQSLYDQFETIHREEGPPWPARETLKKQRGSCRDLTVLFINACRVQGIPARFVSGYQEGDPDQDNRDLHAWAEVYLPGGGWRGYDPTHGLAVADRHVAVAAAASAANAAPVTGSFRKTGAVAEMESTVNLKVATDGDAV